MRLISKFHDYYDTALAQGRDETVLYLRERSLLPVEGASPVLPWNAPSTRWNRTAGTVGAAGGVILNERVHKPRRDWKEGLLPYWSLPDCDRDAVRVREAFVIVAGKAHPVWVRDRAGKALLGESDAGGLMGCVDPDQMIEELREKLTAVKRPHEVTWRRIERSDEDERSYAYARQALLAHDFTNVHIDSGAPVLLLTPVNALYPRGMTMPDALRKPIEAGVNEAPGAMVLNPRLADLGFQRAMHPYSCFQEISQFIEGVIPGQQMPMVSISDKSQVLKKGFDPKYGFRTRPAGMG